MKKKKYLLTIIFIVIMLALYVGISRLYYNKPTEKTKATLAEQNYYVVKNKGGKDTLIVVPVNDSTILVSTPADTAFIKSITIYKQGEWVNKYWVYSCHGTLVVKDNGNENNISDTPNNEQLTMQHLKDFVAEKKEDIINKLDIYQKQQKEINYYFNTHQLQDEGFDVVIRRKECVDRAVDSLRIIAATISRIDSVGNLEISASHRYVANGLQCNKIESYRNGYTMFQTVNHHTPANVRPVFIASVDEKHLAHKHLFPTLATDTIYIGKRDSLGRYTGLGILITRTGYYYEGEFKDGQPHGFGVAFDHRVRAGKWTIGRYRGEQPTYSANHVYGIDVSRYQHESVNGKTHWAVDWKNLRVTSLGHISDKKISGEVNYPVSFVFIKATEGCQLKNQYYHSDYNNARSNGMRVGSYHFFSTKTSAASQANYFLSMCKYQKGDLPPVLDLEPTPAQIAKYGGKNVILWAARTWMEKVENKLGVRPILYIDIQFFNKYLSDDSTNSLTSNYDIWIASYGQYKPHGKLRFWQLCPDGHVSGIHPQVDINIFNGTAETFKSYNK